MKPGPTCLRPHGAPEAWTQLRLVWLRGKIEAGRGEWAAAEVRQLADEMIAVFQEQNLPDDALRALRLCAAAAQREELTAVMARDSASQIRQVGARRANGML